MYSIERLQALQEYCHKASPIRVAVVCLLTPLPALGAIVLLESLPLKSPYYHEWRHDWAFWVRITLTAFIISTAISTMVKNKIPELHLSRTDCVIIGSGCAAGYSSLVAAVAHAGIFPVPFLLVTGMIPLIVFSATMMLMVVGVQRFRVSIGLRSQLKWFSKMLVVKTVLLIIYPAYSAIMMSSPSILQNVLVIGLIALKIMVKNVVSRAAQHLEDYIPIIVILLVDLFNALYLTVAMQTSRSTLTGLLIVGSDWAQLYWTLRGIHRRTLACRELLELVVSQHDPDTARVDFLAIVLRICSKPNELEVAQLQKIRLRACLDQFVSAPNLEMLRKLEAMNVYADGRRARLAKFVAAELRPGQPVNGPVISRRMSSVSVVPVEAGPRRTTELHTVKQIYHSAMKQDLRLSSGVLPVGVQARSSFAVTAANHKTRLLFQALQMLFHTEYLLLLEYVECAIPLVYVVYYSILRELPNASRYLHIGVQSSTYTVLLYAFLEVLSLAVVHFALRHIFQFSPLYQLAFVLENQAEFVQGKLMLWIIILFQFQLLHYGSDFTFKFEWL